MKSMILIFFTILLKVNALEYRCEYAIYRPNGFSLGDGEKPQTITIEEGISLKSSAKHPMYQVFYRATSTNKEYSRYTFSDPLSLKFSEGYKYDRNVVLGDFKLTLERISAEEAYLLFDILDKKGRRSDKFKYPLSSVTSTNENVGIDLEMDQANPLVRIKCNPLFQAMINDSNNSAKPDNAGFAKKATANSISQ
jgi:hypothetical protein